MVVCVENNWNIFLLAAATVGILPSKSSAREDPQRDGIKVKPFIKTRERQPRCHIKRIE